MAGSGNYTLPTEIEEKFAHLPKTRALYYEDAYLREFEAKVLESARAGNHSYVVLDRTGFFPEGGGQPGDQGTLDAQGINFEVLDTKNVGQVVVHILDESFPEKAASAKGVIDWQTRYNNMRHHTAAHIVFSATRSVLRLKDLRYMGFQISRDRVRLDLNREESMTPVQIREVERMANLIALRQLPVKTSFTTRDEAVTRFGSELGLTEVTPAGDVRLVEVGDQDVSLCCGTHVKSTIEVVPIKILARMRLQKGIERLEATTSEYAYAEFSTVSDIISKLSSLLDIKREDVASKVQQLLEERDKMKDEVGKLRLSTAEAEALQYLSTAENFGSFKIVAKTLKDVDADTLKRMALKITNSSQDAIAILGSSGETTHFVASAGVNLLKQELDIGSIVKALAEKMGCRGGGAKNLAQTGGFPEEKIQELARQVRDAIMQNISHGS